MKIDQLALLSEKIIIREKAVELKKRGHTTAHIAEILNVHPNSVRKWCRVYKAYGRKGLIPKAPGKKHNTGMCLPPEKEICVLEHIAQSTPKEMGLPFWLWSRHALSNLIQLVVGVNMSDRTLLSYLDRWRIARQPSFHQNDKGSEQKRKLFERWKRLQYPLIAKEASKRMALIQWCHPKEKMTLPAVDNMQAVPEKLGLIRAVDNKGYVRFMCYRNNVTAALIIEFLDRLHKDCAKPVVCMFARFRFSDKKERALLQDWLANCENEIILHTIP